MLFNDHADVVVERVPAFSITDTMADCTPLRSTVDALFWVGLTSDFEAYSVATEIVQIVVWEYQDDIALVDGNFTLIETEVVEMVKESAIVFGVQPRGFLHH